MKTRIMLCSIVLLLSFFTGTVWGGLEDWYNTFYGHQTGVAGFYDGSTFIGATAGWSNITGIRNTFVGYETGYSNTTGNSNTFLGFQAGAYNIKGHDNIFLGSNAGFHNTEGYNNTFLGNFSGEYNTTASGNTFVGLQAGNQNTAGSSNVFLGFQAGLSNTIGSGNVFLGYNAGYNEFDSNKLYIANTDTSTPLIYGDFGTGIMTINGKLGIGTNAPSQALHVEGGAGGTALLFRAAPSTDAAVFIEVPGASNTPNLRFLRAGVTKWVISDAPSDDSLRMATIKNGTNLVISSGGDVGIGTVPPGGYKLYVNGTTYSTGGFVPSDIRFKENFAPIESALTKVMDMEGISYTWKTQEFKEKGFPEGRHFGVIAQEVEKVLPEVVVQGPSGEKAVSYTELVPVLIQAVKEQQRAIEEQKKEYQKTISMLSERMDELERALQLKGTLAGVK